MAKSLDKYVLAYGKKMDELARTTGWTITRR